MTRTRGVHSPVVVYLLLLLVLTMVMVSIGGMTRHTDSGLSITDWRLIAKITPPVSDLEWQNLFERYQRSPEYRLQNSHMQINDFKQIYWWEWIHRQAGRVIGLVWLLGFAALALAGRLNRRRSVRILLLGTLGLIQGLIGWWMVQSGLTGDRVDVVPTRLATHLTMACLIIALIWWTCLNEIWPAKAEVFSHYPPSPLMIPCIAGLFIQTALGALVAGIDAGAAFPTWPLMNGVLIPELEVSEFGIMQNPTFLHFWHRMAGYGLAFLVLVIALQNRMTVLPVRLLAGAAVLQILLGIATVLTVVEIRLALLHQLLAVILLLLAVTCLYGRLSRPPNARSS